MMKKIYARFSWKSLILPPAPSYKRVPPWVLGIALSMALFLWMMPKTGVDMKVTYGPAGRGTYVEGLIPRNPRFALWLFWVYARLPWRWDYLAMILTAIPILAAGVYFGGGKHWKAFLSFPFFWLLSFGQIDAFIATGFALTWWALQRERYWLMGVGIVFACMLKPHVGIFPVFLMWLWIPHREKWKPLVIPLILVVISLLQWGWDWPISWTRATLDSKNHLEADWANASLYQNIGVLSFLIWLPVVLIPMNRLSRLRCVIAASAISLPYYPAYQMLYQLVFPVSVIEWFLSGLPLAGGWGFNAAASFSMMIVLVSIYPWIATQINQRTLLTLPIPRDDDHTHDDHHDPQPAPSGDGLV